MKPRKFSSALGLFILLSMLAGCAGTEKIPVAEAEQRYLGFLKPGVTTRAEVLAQLGTPEGVFENERIFTYQLVIQPGRGIVHVGRNYTHFRRSDHFRMTVVFDRNGRLERYRLRDF